MTSGGVPRALLAVALLVAAPAPGHAQEDDWPIPWRSDPDPAHTVATIAEQMLAVGERTDPGVSNYTVTEVFTMSAMGGESLPSTVRTYYVRGARDGHTVFDPVAAWVDGQETPPEASPFANAVDVAPKLRAHGRYVARAMMGGRTQHVIELDDPTVFDVAVPGDGSNYTPRKLRAYVDAGSHLLTRMELDGEAMTQDGARTVRLDLWMVDFDESDGLMVPRSRGLSIDEWYSALIDSELRAQLLQLRQMHEQTASAGQRAQIAEGIRRIELELEDGEFSYFSMIFEVESVEVNGGRPSGGR